MSSTGTLNLKKPSIGTLVNSAKCRYFKWIAPSAGTMLLRSFGDTNSQREGIKYHLH
jgi:hypothetical protein